MNDALVGIITIAVAVFLGQFLYKRFFLPTPKEEVVNRTFTGDPVIDKMNELFPD